MENQSEFIDSTTTSLDPFSLHAHPARYDPNETPTVNSTNPNYNPPSSVSQAFDEASEKAKTEFKKGHQQVEDIITKSKRVIKQQCK